MHLYLSHPKFYSSVKAKLTEKDNDILKSAVKEFHDCWQSKSAGDPSECETSVMKHYNLADIKYIVEVIQNVINDLPSEELQDFYFEYYDIYDFSKFFSDSETAHNPLLKVFTQQERAFMETLSEKIHNYETHTTNFEYAEEMAKFMNDNEMFKQVYSKVQTVRKQLADGAA